MHSISICLAVNLPLQKKKQSFFSLPISRWIFTLFLFTFPNLNLYQSLVDLFKKYFVHMVRQKNQFLPFFSSQHCHSSKHNLLSIFVYTTYIQLHLHLYASKTYVYTPTNTILAFFAPHQSHPSSFFFFSFFIPPPLSFLYIFSTTNHHSSTYNHTATFCNLFLRHL